MKGIDFLIIVLLVIVIASGGYMGYLIYSQQNKPAVAVDNNQNNTNDENACVDKDNDGYGTNCTSGEDCDDTNPDLNVNCVQSLDSTLSLEVISPKENYNVGDEFSLAVKVKDIPANLSLDTLQLRVEYNNSIMQYLGQDKAGEGYTALELDPKDNMIRIDFAKPEGIKSEDQVVVLKFKTTKDGLGDIRVSDDTRIGVNYVLKGGSVAIIVGTGNSEAGTAKDSTLVATPEATAPKVQGISTITLEPTTTPTAKPTVVNTTVPTTKE